ncbi:MAG: cyclin-dependent kinase inhibitor 3 family protein [Burkholderiales bacterium]|jgi:protein-tyrosine phosphatase|nr:cyclin-dependent kinase inhibitor 3 family protein [Burkholderiales bacterium]
MKTRTSLSDPLRLDELPVGNRGGLLGITLCPGKKAPSLEGFLWDRDLELDLDAIDRWGAKAVLTLIEDEEFDTLKVPALGAGVKARGLHWHHLPITDTKVPDARFESGWAKSGDTIRARLLEGGRVVIHCKGGLGRAGTVAARILIEVGTPPADAIRQVRAVRKGAIENDDQERYVLALGPGAKR